MITLTEIIAAIQQCEAGVCSYCPYAKTRGQGPSCRTNLHTDTVKILKEQAKEIDALRLLLEWAEECDFGFDNFHEEYEKYKDEIKGMNYIDGMIHVAKRTNEDRNKFKGE